MLNYKQRLELLMKCKEFKIRQKQLAEIIGKTDSWISQWINNPEINLAEEDEQVIIEYLNKF